MSEAPMVEVCVASGRVLVDAEGAASRHTERVERWVLERALETLELDLEGLELDDGVAAAQWHDLVRRLRDRHGSITLFRAPQMLAHTLYKVGDLLDGRIVLVEPRSDEGTTAG